MKGLAAIYNGLEDVYDVNKRIEARPEAVASLAKLLVANGLDKAYDIRLVHKHFDINEGEQVVAFDGENAKVSAVCADGELPFDVLGKHGIQPESDAVIAPSDYIITEQGDAIPYEFAYGSAPSSAPHLEKGFLTEWNSILRHHDLMEVLGLAIQEGTPLGGHEMSDIENRTNKLSFAGDMPSESTLGFATTSWRADGSDGGLMKVMKCTFCTVVKARHNCA